MVMILMLGTAMDLHPTETDHLCDIAASVFSSDDEALGIKPILLLSNLKISLTPVTLVRMILEGSVVEL